MKQQRLHPEEDQPEVAETTTAEAKEAEPVAKKLKIPKKWCKHQKK